MNFDSEDYADIVVCKHKREESRPFTILLIRSVQNDERGLTTNNNYFNYQRFVKLISPTSRSENAKKLVALILSRIRCGTVRCKGTTGFICHFLGYIMSSHKIN